MTKEALAFKDVARKAGVSLDTSYRLAERKSPKFVTEQVLAVGKVLGFSHKQIREKVRQDRLESKKTCSKKGRFYQLLGELIELFDSKI
jgi:hypothetical protein